MIIIKSYSCCKCQTRHYISTILFDKHLAYNNGVDERIFQSKKDICAIFDLYKDGCYDSNCPFGRTESCLLK